jgi:hypothetical protein
VVIGQIVTFDGREFRIVGFTPMGVTPRTVQIESRATGLTVTVPLEALRARLRLVEPEPDAA